MGSLPDRCTHLLTRASQNRSLADGGSLFPVLAAFPEAHRYMLDLTAQPGSAAHDKPAWRCASDRHIRRRLPAPI